jgi:chemotaxis protein MotB
MAAHDDVGLASSLTDLMTSLMVIFILLLVATLNNAGQGTQSVRRDLMRQLRHALSALGGPGGATRVTVSADPRDPLGLIIVVPRHLLDFAPGRATIPPGGDAFLDLFAPELAGVVCSPKFRGKLASVTIEGHTDPMGTGIYNVGLSQNRATAVAVAALGAIAHGPKRECFEQVLAVSGRGKAGAVGTTTAEMASERRVEFRVRLQSEEERSVRRALAEGAGAGG